MNKLEKRLYVPVFGNVSINMYKNNCIKLSIYYKIHFQTCYTVDTNIAE